MFLKHYWPLCKLDFFCSAINNQIIKKPFIFYGSYTGVYVNVQTTIFVNVFWSGISPYEKARSFMNTKWSPFGNYQIIVVANWRWNQFNWENVIKPWTHWWDSLAHCSTATSAYLLCRIYTAVLVIHYQ